jgi:hypothetical protein
LFQVEKGGKKEKIATIRFVIRDLLLVLLEHPTDETVKCATLHTHHCSTHTCVFCFVNLVLNNHLWLEFSRVELLCMTTCQNNFLHRSLCEPLDLRVWGLNRPLYLCLYNLKSTYPNDTAHKTLQHFYSWFLTTFLLHIPLYDSIED